MIADNWKKVFNLVYYVLTAILLFCIVRAVWVGSWEVLKNCGLNALFIPWLLLLFIRLKMMNDNRRKGANEYRRNLQQKLRRDT